MQYGYLQRPSREGFSMVPMVDLFIESFLPEIDIICMDICIYNGNLHTAEICIGDIFEYREKKLHRCNIRLLTVVFTLKIKKNSK